MVFQIHRIGCVWKTPFRKSGHKYCVSLAVSNMTVLLKHLSIFHHTSRVGVVSTVVQLTQASSLHTDHVPVDTYLVGFHDVSMVNMLRSITNCGKYFW